MSTPWQRARAVALTQELVDRVFRVIPDPGPDPDYEPLDEADYAALTRRFASEVDRDEGLWVFAYGSLLWKPTFTFVEHRQAIVHGWHRAFCLRLTRWRGTPEVPGLMLALARGGMCKGVVFRLPRGGESQEIDKLMRREVVYRRPGNHAHWFRARTPQGVVRALGFVANTRSAIYTPQPPIEATADMLARACGHGGSCAEYLYRTIDSLERHGIHDPFLWRLQDMVAERIRADSEQGTGAVSLP